MKQTISILALICFVSAAMASQTRLTRSEYIDKWKDEAIYQMVVYKIPASVTLAQGILESGDGNSELARGANNHFGIKCHSTWTGEKAYHDDDKKGECFRVYNHAQLSYDDHSEFLLKNRYSSLFDLKITDYKGWAKGLKKCGYATSPKYANLLIGLIEDNNLTQFDKVGMKMIKNGDMPDREAFSLGESVAEATKKERKKEKKQKRYTGNNKLPEVSISLKRSIKISDNNIKFILAKEGDTFESIARELEIMPWQIWKYNDLSKSSPLTSGQMLYIQPKRGTAKAKWHMVVEGETMLDISQKHGIKMSKLYKKNNMIPDSQPEVGQKLSLRARM